MGRDHRILRSSLSPRQLSLLIDANARVGSARSASIGSAQSDPEDALGHELHKLLLSLDVCSPATFHPTGQQGAWCARNDRLHRIDYGCVPLGWLPCVSQASARPDMSLATALQPDRFLASVTVEPLDVPPRPVYQAKPSRALLTVPSIQQRAAEALAMAPHPPPGMSVEVLEQSLSACAGSLFAQLCPPQARRPRHPWLIDRMWGCSTRCFSLAPSVPRIVAAPSSASATVVLSKCGD